MEYPDFKKIFSRFNAVQALVIGDVMIDSYIWGKVERISPEAPVPVVAVEKRENRLGGAANVALNIQALGAKPILCSVIGNDTKGKEFTKILKKEKLTDIGIIQSKQRITTTKFRIIGNNSQMLRVDEENNSAINQPDLKRFIKTIEQIIKTKKIDVIIFEDYDKGVISAELIQNVVRIASSKKIPITADPKKNNFNNYKNITLFKPNLKELREGLKTENLISNSKEFQTTADHLQLNNNIENLMITLSEAGIYFSQKEKNSKKIKIRNTIPAHIRNIADVSGAGDTVISVASICIALNLDIYWVVTLANLAGGLVCEEVGVVPIKKEKLLKETYKLTSNTSAASSK
ncbi:MAG TPA: bifunctional ADP-heptose synthase [Bacteroidales bacterium]|nr:bifunctional ADP-heptose synthase [Bacteroidales bacterium]